MMQNNKSKIVFNSLFKMFLEYAKIFFLIFFAITIFNVVLSLLFDGYSNITFSDISGTVIMNMSIFSITLAIVYAVMAPTTYIDIFMMLSLPRKYYFSSIFKMNVVITLFSTAVINSVLFMEDISERGIILVFSLIGIFFIVNMINFISFIGKRYGWYYVVGIFCLIASLILLFVNYIGGFILMNMFGVHLISFLLLMNVLVIFVNKFLIKKLEFKY
ncbi:hypothetical protein C7380_10842 [Oceanotoga teriensis]|uniref:Uncharacterized protein n=2 Tax=Petrotogaceae TaxID=1643949 RepID=A0AA45C6W2_9BACT|nr:hypothetical protein C7380_10842 [Oceanotoga teriensis]